MTRFAIIARRNWIWLALSWLWVACGPSDGNSTPQANLFPLNLNNQWIYQEELLNGSLVGELKKTIVAQTTFKGVPVWIQRTEQTNSLAVKNSFLKDDRVMVWRLRQERSWMETGELLDAREYEPGFLRVNHSLLEPGATLQETHVRNEFSADGTLSQVRTKQYTWIVEKAEVPVEVPAGNFLCLQVKRTDADGEIKRYWYAEGVGKVMEEGAFEYEKLLYYTLAP